MRKINGKQIERIAAIAEKATEIMVYLLLLWLMIFEVWELIGMPTLAEHIFFAINMILVGIAVMCLTTWIIAWIVDGFGKSTN